jgi:hypothetical protein
VRTLPLADFFLRAFPADMLRVNVCSSELPSAPSPSVVA